MCESEKASKRASEHVRPRYVSPRAMNSDLASLELVHPETRHFHYRLLGKAVILPGLRGCKNKQATRPAETKTRSNVPCGPVTGLEPQKTLTTKGGSQPHTSARSRRSYLLACLYNSARRFCAVGQAIAHALWGFMQGCEVRALAGAPGCRRRMGQKLCAGQLFAGHMHQPISTCAGASSPVQSQGQSRGYISGWQLWWVSRAVLVAGGGVPHTPGAHHTSARSGCAHLRDPRTLSRCRQSTHVRCSPFAYTSLITGKVPIVRAASVRAGARNTQRVCWHRTRARWRSRPLPQ
jgi:hypothetical protein